MTTCPLCASTRVVDTVRRSTLPAMQNYVYRTHEAAIAAPRGELTLAVCRDCGFAWNRTFDPERLVYDEGYDNAVPSAVMASYYDEIAEYLAGAHELSGGLVVDVGCGDGTFLRTICAAVPDCRGLGVDPALDRNREEDDGRVVLVKDVFTSATIVEHPALVVSRHVLEHIPRPVEFLKEIRDALVPFEPSPSFFEVPDLEWILTHTAFWDFCYEHCNYFTAETLTAAIRRAGFEPLGARSAFGSQYLWGEGTSSPSATETSKDATGEDVARRALAYAAAEIDAMGAMRATLQGLSDDGHTIAVWGMATKGVLFSLLVDPDASLIDYCIDVNPNKQDCFVPVTGHRISPPSRLQEASEDRPLAIAVMNDNYADEIAATCREMGLTPIFVSVSADAAR